MTTDGTNFTEALQYLQGSAAAVGYVVQVQLGSGKYPAGSRRRLSAAGDANGMLGSFGAATVASEVRLVGEGATFAAMRSTVFEVLPGSPPVHFRGLAFTGSVSDAPVVAVRGSSVVLEDCAFDGNPYALLIEGGSVLIRRTNFTSNGNHNGRRPSAQGGAVHAAGTSVVYFSGVRFVGNVASQGGALFAAGSARLEVSQTLLLQNQATDGGALSVVESARVMLRNQTELRSNRATGSANAILLRGTGSAVLYVLPAPRGHWIAGAQVCSPQSVDSTCTSELWDATYTALSHGSHNVDYPFVCNAGLLGDTLEPQHQSSPQCSGACPSRFFCPAGTVTPTPCPIGSFCRSGSAVPVLCPPGTWGERPMLASDGECSVSEPGYWSFGGVRYECSLGTYNSKRRVSDVLDCLTCPPHSNTTGVATTSREACECDAEYFDRRESPTADSAADYCQPCVTGTKCSASGIRVARLPLDRGYYRVSNVSYDVRRCPDAASNCSTHEIACSASSSGCRGGADFGQRCMPGLTGVFCLKCEPGNQSANMYYVQASGTEAAHCEPCDNNPSEGVAVLIGVLAALVAAALLVGRLIYRLRHQLPSLISEQRRAELVRRWETATPMNKGKQIYGFYLIASRLPEIYDVVAPDLASRWLSFTAVFTSVGIDFLQGTPLDCLGLGGFKPRLQFYIFLPPVTVLCILVASSVFLLAKSGTLDAADVNGLAMPVVLRFIFIVYPLVVNTAFEAWSCYDFPGEGAWVRTQRRVSKHWTGSYRMCRSLLAHTNSGLLAALPSPFACSQVHRSSPPVCTAARRRLCRVPHRRARRNHPLGGGGRRAVRCRPGTLLRDRTVPWTP